MRGLAAGLAEVLPGDPQLEVLDTGEGYTRVNVAWPDGARAKLDVHPDHVDWKNLEAATPRKATGLYTGICERTPAFFKGRGCDHYLMAPASLEAKRRLLRRLAWYEIDGGVYRHDL